MKRFKKHFSVQHLKPVTLFILFMKYYCIFRNHINIVKHEIDPVIS